MMGKKTLVFLGLLTLAGACSSVPRAEDSRYSKVVITDYQMRGEICHDMKSFTPQKVRQFFDRATAVTYDIIHERYDELPCLVTGTLEMAGQSYFFGVRAIGIGYLERNSITQWYGCPGCDDLFPSKD